MKFRSDFLDADLNRVSISKVQQVNDKAFFKRGERWVDAAVVDRSQAVDRVVSVGSAEFRDLVTVLMRRNRQECIALDGEILLRVDGEPVLIR